MKTKMLTFTLWLLLSLNAFADRECMPTKAGASICGDVIRTSENIIISNPELTSGGLFKPEKQNGVIICSAWSAAWSMQDTDRTHMYQRVKKYLEQESDFEIQSGLAGGFIARFISKVDCTLKP